MPEKPGKVTYDGPAVVKRGFVQVPVLLLIDDTLSQGAKLLYALLLWYIWRGRGEGEYPGHEQAAVEAGCSRSSLMRYMRELEKAGLVKATRPGRGEANSYEVLSPKEPLEREA